MNKTEYAIQQDGSIFRRDINETEIALNDSVFENISASTVRKVRNVFVVPNWGTAHIAIAADQVYLTLRIDHIPIRAPFKLIEKLLVPVFNSRTEPVMPMNWVPPEGMKLILLMATGLETDAVYGGKTWLFAINDRREAYRLPLPNLFDDCAICEGEWSKVASNLQEYAQKTCDQLEHSKWNADLWKSVELSQKCFRFKPLKESFQQVASECAHWHDLCIKVGVDVQKYIVI